MATSKKDYVAVAEILAHEMAVARRRTDTVAALAAVQTVENVISHLADHFQSTAPKFDRARFVAACGFTR